MKQKLWISVRLSFYFSTASFAALLCALAISQELYFLAAFDAGVSFLWVRNFWHILDHVNEKIRAR